MLSDPQECTPARLRRSVGVQVFDQVAVKIFVAVGAGRRRRLAMEMADRSQLPASELASAR